MKVLVGVGEFVLESCDFEGVAGVRGVVAAESVVGFDDCFGVVRDDHGAEGVNDAGGEGPLAL